LALAGLLRLLWQRRREAGAARTRVEALAAGAGLTRFELDRLATRLPVLRALHAALAHEQAGLAGRRAQADAFEASLAALSARVAGLAEICGLAPVAGGHGESPAARLDHVRRVLDRLDDTFAAQRRRTQLAAEDAQLAAQQRTYDVLAEQATRSSEAVTQLEARL